MSPSFSGAENSVSACWAAQMGGCKGPVNREHLVSKAILGSNPWMKTTAPDGRETVFFGGATAPILCQAHNRELGRTADRVAKQLTHALTAAEPLALRGSRVLRSRVDLRISGTDYGRWLCKTHCDFMVSRGETPDRAYVCYAFLRPLPCQVFFYFVERRDRPARASRPREAAVTWQLFTDDRNPASDIFAIVLAGLETIVSTIPLPKVSRTGRLVDRADGVRIPTQFGSRRIAFDWSREPQVQSALRRN